MRQLLTIVTIAAISLFAFGEMSPQAQGKSDNPFAGRSKGGSVFQTIDKRFAKISADYVDGRNVVLAFVDGKAITSEQIKAELGPEIETLTEGQLAIYPRDQRDGEARKRVEFSVIFEKGRMRILEEIKLYEARSAGLKPESNRAQVEVMIESAKDERGIARDDLETWARYTLQNWGLTPLEFRKRRLELLLQKQILEMMAGEYGTIQGLKLPIYLPLKVTPAELRKDYRKNKSFYRVASDIKFRSLGVEMPLTLSSEERNKLGKIMSEGLRRAQEGESFSDVKSKYIDIELEKQGLASLPGVKILLNTKGQAATDADLDKIGELTRGIEPGSISSIRPIRSKNPSGDTDIFAFVALDQRNDEKLRSFNDPVVQRQITNKIKAEKRRRNQERVEDFLLKRAVLFPKNLRGS